MIVLLAQLVQVEQQILPCVQAEQYQTQLVLNVRHQIQIAKLDIQLALRLTTYLNLLDIYGAINMDQLIPLYQRIDSIV
jgi:hypothetical protein